MPKKSSSKSKEIPLPPIAPEFLKSTPVVIKEDVRLFATAGYAASRTTTTIYTVPADKILRIKQVINTYATAGFNPAYNSGLFFIDAAGNEIASFLPPAVGATTYADTYYDCKEIKLVAGDTIATISDPRCGLGASAGFCVLSEQEIDTFKIF